MKNTGSINDSRIKQIVSLIDLTNLNDVCNDDAIQTLCEQSQTPVGRVAAICIWPAFVTTAKKHIGASSVGIATVINFPDGEESMKTNCIAIDAALADGADEIDYVLPYQQLIAGKVAKVTNDLKTIRNQIPSNIKLKVILETGVLDAADLIQSAASIAIDQGADFIKTSTGKVPVNATPAAAEIMLDAIANSPENVGFKAAGGIKTVADADCYLNLAEDRLGHDWIDATHFRFGASGLLQNALSSLRSDAPPPTGQESNY